MTIFYVLCLFFFFQAEDGIRDADVTGVQTCALPISPAPGSRRRARAQRRRCSGRSPAGAGDRHDRPLGLSPSVALEAAAVQRARSGIRPPASAFPARAAGREGPSGGRLPRPPLPRRARARTRGGRPAHRRPRSGRVADRPDDRGLHRRRRRPRRETAPDRAVNLRQGRVLRIGHRGAAALAPENTLASIEAAIEYKLDLVEIDVVAHANALRLAHSPAEVKDESPTLDEALALVARAAAGVILDLKSRGIERSAVEALGEHNLLDRAVVASFHPARLRKVKKVEPALTTGFSYPFDRAGISERPAFGPLIRVGLSGLRRALPVRIAGMLARSQANALVVHHASVGL